MAQMSVWAEREAVSRLSTVPLRLCHTKGVVETAHCLAALVDAGDADLLVAAAWLHDIGYAPELSLTCFHPLDGARYLRKAGQPDRLINLVARHSCSIVEARLRGVSDELAQFPDERGPVRDALWYCDMTTSPEGKSVTLDERLAEIRRRYGSGVVSTFTKEARPLLRGAMDRTMQRMRDVTCERQL